MVASILSTSIFLLASLASSSPIVPPPSLLRRHSLLEVRNGALSNITSLPAESIQQSSALSSNLTVISSAIENNNVSSSGVAVAYASLLAAIKPAPTPSTIEEIRALVQGEFASKPTNLIENAASLLLKGLDTTNTPNNVVKRDTSIDSTNNVNTRTPARTIYPRASSSDPNYSVSESKLRSAIYIPPGFQYGAGSKQPVILVPGTALPGGTTYSGNIAKLLAGTSFADPLWINIPGSSLDDIQVSAEYVIYAINYISSISGGSKVSVITWSQGSLNTHWGLKYFPSTRALVNGHIAASADYHGTTLAYILCPGFPTIACDMSVLQQTYGSKFIAKMRSGGGDSAYVPTTTIYSIFDEVVQPQAGTGASSYINDALGVGVTNNELQTVCSGKPAGGFYTHEAVLYNPVAWALVVDALTHPGPGQISRINLEAECGKIVADGITAADVLATEGMLLVAVKNALLYFPKSWWEAAFKSYVV